MMANLDSFDNISDISDIGVLLSIELNSYDNISDISNINITYSTILNEYDNINIISLIGTSVVYDITEYDNNSVIPSIYVTKNYILNSFNNTIIITPINIVIPFSISIDSYNNTNTIPPINITPPTFGISINSYNNTNTISPINIVPPTFNISINSYNNTNIISIIRVNHTILPNSFINQSTISPLGSLYNQIIGIEGVTNSPYISNIGINKSITTVISGIPSLETNTKYYEKTEFKYSDISFDFILHPLTGDIGKVFDADAINQSIKNIINTNKFEYSFDDYDVASNLRRQLFELCGDSLIQSEIKKDIFISLMNHEPRINIIDVSVTETAKQHEIKVIISYQIKKSNTMETYKFLLSRT